MPFNPRHPKCLKYLRREARAAGTAVQKCVCLMPKIIRGTECIACVSETGPGQYVHDAQFTCKLPKAGVGIAVFSRSATNFLIHATVEHAAGASVRNDTTKMPQSMSRVFHNAYPMLPNVQIGPMNVSGDFEIDIRVFVGEASVPRQKVYFESLTKILDKAPGQALLDDFTVFATTLAGTI